MSGFISTSLQSLAGEIKQGNPQQAYIESDKCGNPDIDKGLKVSASRRQLPIVRSKEK